VCPSRESLSGSPMGRPEPTFSATIHKRNSEQPQEPASGGRARLTSFEWHAEPRPPMAAGSPVTEVWSLGLQTCIILDRAVRSSWARSASRAIGSPLRKIVPIESCADRDTSRLSLSWSKSALLPTSTELSSCDSPKAVALSSVAARRTKIGERRRRPNSASQAARSAPADCQTRLQRMCRS